MMLSRETYWTGKRCARFAVTAVLLFLIGMGGRFLYVQWAAARTLRLGEEALQADHYEEAQRYLESSLTYRPGHYQTYLLLARVCRQRGDFERAQEYLVRAADLPEATPKELRLERLRFRVAQGEAERVRGVRNAVTIYEQGLREMDQGQHEHAIDTFQQVLNLDPLHALTHQKLSECLRRVGKSTEADEHAARYKELEVVSQRMEALVIERDRTPENATVYYQIGELWYKQGKVAAAMNNFRIALELDLRHQATNKLLADFYEKSGEEDQAAVYRGRVRK